MEYCLDDDVVLMKLQADEICRVIQESSDLEFAYLLQLQEVQIISAMTGELVNSPDLLLLASNSATTQVLSEGWNYLHSSSMLNQTSLEVLCQLGVWIGSPCTCLVWQIILFLSADRQLVLHEQNEEAERLNQELQDAAMALSEQSRFTELNAIIEHDRRFSRALQCLPDVEWRKTGERFSDPFVASEGLKSYASVLHQLTLYFPDQGLDAGMGPRSLLLSSSVWEPTVLSKAFFVETVPYVGQTVSCESGVRSFSQGKGKLKLWEADNRPPQTQGKLWVPCSCSIVAVKSCEWQTTAIDFLCC